VHPEDHKALEDKLQALAELAAGAGHELNNPVATISGHVQQLLPGERDPDRILALQTIGAQALRIRDMIGDLMLFARPPQPQLVRLDLHAIAEEVVSKLSGEADQKNCRLSLKAVGPLLVLGDTAHARTLFSGVTRNAIEAASGGGQVVLEGSQILHEGRPAARWVWSDTGRGLQAHELEHLFDPFFSGRQAGRGLGFGLAKAWRIATLHQAILRVTSPVGCSAVLTLIWPLDT
jgi:two-component system NtrC family sensor kinase